MQARRQQIDQAALLAPAHRGERRAPSRSQLACDVPVEEAAGQTREGNVLLPQTREKVED